MIIIRRVNEPHGCWGNMSPFPVVWKDKEFRTTEALFQSMRFDDESIIEEIRAEKSPMGAKFIAKTHEDEMVVVPRSVKDLDNMRVCLRLKLGQHPHLVEELLKTGSEQIVEDCTNRQKGSGLFWGAALIDGKWTGENWLGLLWMEVRQEISKSNHKQDWMK